MNNRPVDNPDIASARKEILAVYERYGLAGGFSIIDANEFAYGYVLATDWSAVNRDAKAPMGLRITAKVSELGQEKAHELLEGAAHTFCSLSDFGAQTFAWGNQLVDLLRESGLEIEHTPYGGQKLGKITSCSE